jgi:predicted TIM-barrel fold metal-dependent hydrolase
MQKPYRIFPVALLAMFVGSNCVAFQDPANRSENQPKATTGLLQTSEPPTTKSQLVVPQTDIQRAAFPVVDVHSHFWAKARHDPELLKRYVEMMDRNNIAVSVSLDGTLPSRLEEHRKFLWTEYEDRFVIFGNLDFQGAGKEGEPSTWACNQPDFVRNQVELIREAANKRWISGLKFFKDFGLRYRNSDGSLIAIDDTRWFPIWSVCGELGLPVIMHSADPAAFFEPTTPTNERYLELKAHPDWSFAGPEFPTRAELHAARNHIIELHPKTTFIAAHFGNDAEDLGQLSTWLDRYPNLVVEFASRINELGRQPYSSRRFLEKYQDRILFGTDGPWPEARLRLYWRFLETYDEYFAYSEKTPPPQGDWRIYGVGLEPAVLQKIYSENAARIIPGVRERLAKYHQAQ